MSARDRVLADIRRALNRTGPLPASVTRGLDARVKRPTSNTLPALADEPLALFKAQCAAVNGIVTEVPDWARVAAIVAKHLKTYDLEGRLIDWLDLQK